MWLGKAGARLVLCFAQLCAAGVFCAAAAEQAAPHYIPQAAEVSAVTMLSTARTALFKLDNSTDKLEREIAFDQAISGLTVLYQLHGCNWALEPLISVYNREDCPDLHVGYSRDGRLCLRVQRLVLKDPVYRDWAVYLCTFESNSSLTLKADDAGRLTFELKDGSTIIASALNANNPLYKKLGRMAETFRPVSEVPPGTGQSFKQVVAVRGRPGRLNPGGISAVSLRWGKYLVKVPYYASEVRVDRRAES